MAVESPSSPLKVEGVETSTAAVGFYGMFNEGNRQSSCFSVVKKGKRENDRPRKCTMILRAY